ncbi:EAL domain-containing protein [Simiduia curdlanivorans]|uniref:EAL domain-containing protein n=1 Tax=Simiduia curdlanivorans TaxID=1492769 RepID=A0ABV8V4P3_9GAMM|nr:EAL domain-containing protein [Simiduia curdlanivorans]MDN3638238.1 EAL domain-containing protein [Simiduia curdlanivorans]
MTKQMIGQQDSQILAQRVAFLEAQLEARENAIEVQKALFEIADLSFKSTSLDALYASAHQVTSRLMYAANFYISLENTKRGTIQFPYYVDTMDPAQPGEVIEVPFSELDSSLSAYLIKHDTTVFLQGEQAFEQLIRQHRLALVGVMPQCLIGVPLKRTTGQRGAIVVQSYQRENQFTESDKEILSFLAQHIATAMDRFERREQLERQVEERTKTLKKRNIELKKTLSTKDADRKLQAALYSISQLSHTESEVDNLYPKIHKILSQLFYARNFYVAILNEDGDSITFPYFADHKDITTRSRKLSNGATEYILHTRAPQLINKARLEKLIANGELEIAGSRPFSWIGAPIVIGETAYGVIAAQSYDETREFNEHDLELLSFVADQLAEAIKRQKDSDALLLANITLEARVNQRTWELSEINNKLEGEVEERKRAEELQKTLFTIDELTQTTSDLHLLYREIHQLVARFIHAKNFFVAEYNKLSNKLYFPYYADDDDQLCDFTETTEDDTIPHMPFKHIEKTLTAYVIRTGEALLATREVRHELEAKGEIGLVGKEPEVWMGVPLIYDEHVAGVIVVQTYDKTDRFGQKELDLLQFVSSHVTTALQKKFYRESLEARVEERTLELADLNKSLQDEIKERQRAEHLQTALFRIADISASTSDMSNFYKHIHDAIGQLMYAKYFFIALPDIHDPDILTFPYYIDISDKDPAPRPMGNHLTEHVMKSGQPLLLNPSNVEEITSRINIKGQMPVSWLGVPLQLDNEVLGALVVQTYDTAFVLGKNEEELLTYVSHHVATALDRKRARDQLEQRVDQRTQELRQANISLERQIEIRREIEKKLEFDAFHDVLTKLPNRMLFMDRLAQLIGKGNREDKFQFAVLFLDLDRFKVINDSLGHLAGDKLLQQVGVRLTKLVRPQDTVARLGGDEFCLLLDDVQGLNFAELVAKRICEDLTKPFVVLGNEVFTSTSIGVAYSALGYERAEDMLRDADAAMYQAKLLGKRQYAVFDQSMHTKAMNTLKLETELRNAINNNEIDVFYQPIMRLGTTELDGFEALARWQHPNQGLIPPSDFIPLAEESGLIIDLDIAMCLKACIQVSQWHKKYQCSVSISVNLSSKHFSRSDLVDRIKNVLQISGIDPALLKLEITESALMENVIAAQKILGDLKQLGVFLAMDDFGTGYSSLSYLHRFPLDVLKVDRCFIDEVDVKNENRAIVTTIVTLADALGMTSVAEGIETQAQLAVITELGCDLGQGYLFARPMNHQDAENYIAEISPTA